METGNGGFWGDDMFGIIIFLIIAGMFSGNGFGFGGNKQSEITNDFAYTNLASQLRDNASAINVVDRDVLESKYALDRDILENRYQNALQTQTLSSSIESCCCSLKSAIADDGEKTRALINANRMADLQYQLEQANTAIANAVQTQNILNTLGTFYSKPAVNPYTAYNTCGVGNTII